ncbi:MAG: nucleotidyltransferase domain-containing protein [Candidatus Promineifilaceae bacterium]|nr:nucleotidyltransferase domain-containing protein [Candidatus Promineifilaceae bacterium]
MGFDTSVLDRALAQRQARREEERRALLADVLRKLDALAEQFDLQEAYVFGSVARPGRYREDSDVDVAVAGLPSEQFISLMAQLSASLGRDVDMIELEKIHFADKIKREGIKWTRRS